uniref:HTH psq-type domain-containing protein n=1 Tax=Paramormyrops kingsleyae TaxID=1676925 RepID=A0A3B3STR4_9TELE
MRCPASSKPSGSSEPKRHRMTLTIQEKVKCLNMLWAGKRYADVARYYGLNELTVRYVKKDEKNIRATTSLSFIQTGKRVGTPRNKAIVKMESHTYTLHIIIIIILLLLCYSYP